MSDQHWRYLASLSKLALQRCDKKSIGQLLPHKKTQIKKKKLVSHNRTFLKNKYKKKRNRSAASKVFFPMRRRIPTWWPHLLTRPPLPTAEQSGQPIYTNTNTNTNMNIWFGNPIVASLEKGTFYTLDPKEPNPIKPGTFWTFYHLGGGRSALKLSPELLEGVTCSKKGLKMNTKIKGRFPEKK